jgi:PPE-repeat protein
MDFATLPPETNSGRMFAGPGAGSMMKAATAWDGLAARLCTAAGCYREVTSKIAARCEAAPPYVDWLDDIAARARQAAARLAAVAGAHRSALAVMVPPPVIAANRARGRSLATRNCLGQAGPAIADVDAEYERMWARDADAMYAYAAAAADAAALAPFTPPPGNQGASARTWTLQSAPDVLSAGDRVMSTIPEALQAFSRSPLTPIEASLSPMTASLSRLSSLSAPSDAALKHLNALNKGAALRSLFTRPAPVGRAAATARLGRAATIGGMSVPRAWAAARAPIAVCRGTVA